MLAQPGGFLEDRDLYLAERSAGFIVFLDEIGELDSACESGWSATDEHDIHWNCFGIEWLANDQPVNRKRRLVLARHYAEGPHLQGSDHATCALRRKRPRRTRSTRSQ